MAEGLDKYAEMFQSLDGADNYDIKRWSDFGGSGSWVRCFHLSRRIAIWSKVKASLLYVVNISLTKFCNWDIRLWKNYSAIITRAFLSRTCKLSSALALRLCFWLINITSRRRRSSKTMNLLDQVTSSTIRCRSRFDETLDQWSMLSFPKIRWWCEGF